MEVDFEIDFSNGGGLQGQGFRLDIPADDITDADAAGLLVRALGLLMVGEVRIVRKGILVEPHRRPAGPAPASSAGDGRIRIDVSHAVTEGMITYPGLPAPVIDAVLTREASRSHYAPGTEFLIGRISLCGNTGTYVDSPFHRYPDGPDLAALPLERLADLDAITISVAGSTRRAIDRPELLPYDVRGRAVLLRTDWSRHWGTDGYFHGHPYLTEAAARHLVAEGALLVGIDSLNIDDTDGGQRPAHSVLLAAGIPICEHLTDLAALPADGYRFSAVPVGVRGLATFPVRAWAVMEASRAP